jgi:hypothetical protein
MYHESFFLGPLMGFWIRTQSRSNPDPDSADFQIQNIIMHDIANYYNIIFYCNNSLYRA